MKERERVVEVVRSVRVGLAHTHLVVHSPEHVEAFPREIIVQSQGREYTITVTENRKSRLK